MSTTKRQHCNECDAWFDLIYMACPICHSLNVVEVEDALPLNLPDDEPNEEVSQEDCEHHWVPKYFGSDSYICCWCGMSYWDYH